MLVLDTNILVYTADVRDATKHATALEVVERAVLRGDCAVALQSIGETCNALRKRMLVSATLAAQTAKTFLNRFPAFGYDAACVERALSEASGGRFSCWDALLLSAASAAGCTMLSEDMQNGFQFDALTIVNPFAADGSLSRAAAEALKSK